MQEEDPSVPSLEQQAAAAELAAAPYLAEMAYSSVPCVEGVRSVPLYVEERYRIPFA